MKKSLPMLILLACAAAFVFGVFQLFELRFQTGDVYQPYSSLRTDPLGAMAFYESIEKLRGVSVRRDFSASNRLPEDANVTYLHLAASEYEWDWMTEDTFREIDNFVRSGGRLVITLFPESSGRYHRWDSDSETNAEPASKKDSKDAKDSQGTKDKKNAEKNDSKKTPAKKSKRKSPLGDDDSEIKVVSLEEKWGIAFGFTNLMAGGNEVYEPARVRNETALPLPTSLEWHSGIILTNLDPAWQAIYSRGTNPVVVERKFGHGTVVIATDSYFLSNEAMVKDRHPDFLAWLVGPGKTVVFDEAHLGTVETSGVSGLMRKYRLYWFVAGLVLLAALFIWKNSLSLVPPYLEQTDGEYIAGKETASGFVNLLRRNIPAGNLLETCFAEWRRSAAQSGKYSQARLRQAEAIFQAEKSLPANNRNALIAYREISAALTNRNTDHGNRNSGNATNP